MRIYIDITSGKLLRSASGPEQGALIFTNKDIVNLEVVFVDSGQPVTTTVLADGALLKVGIKARPGVTPLLAFTGAYTLLDEVAQMTLNLTTAAITTFFSTMVSVGAAGGPAVLEVEVSAADETSRETYAQHPVFIRREVNATTDTAPDTEAVALYVLKALLFDADGRGVSANLLNVRREVTARTGGIPGCLDYIPTGVLSTGTMFAIRIAGSGGELWCLEDDAVTVADGVLVVDPLDFTTRKWKRIL